MSIEKKIEGDVENNSTAKELMIKIIQKGGIRVQRLRNLIEDLDENTRNEAFALWHEVEKELGMKDDDISEIEEDERRFFESLRVWGGSSVKILSRKEAPSSIKIKSRKKS